MFWGWVGIELEEVVLIVVDDCGIDLKGVFSVDIVDEISVRDNIFDDVVGDIDLIALSSMSSVTSM